MVVLVVHTVTLLPALTSRVAAMHGCAAAVAGALVPVLLVAAAIVVAVMVAAMTAGTIHVVVAVVPTALATGKHGCPAAGGP